MFFFFFLWLRGAGEEVVLAGQQSRAPAPCAPRPRPVRVVPAQHNAVDVVPKAAAATYQFSHREPMGPPKVAACWPRPGVSESSSPFLPVPVSPMVVGGGTIRSPCASCSNSYAKKCAPCLSESEPSERRSCVCCGDTHTRDFTRVSALKKRTCACGARPVQTRAGT